MKHITLRNIKLVDELMSFCYKYGAKKININIENTDNKVIIDLKAYIEHISEKTLEILNTLLSAPRCREMEEYYWNLSGNDDTDTELTLVGMMSDEAEINYNPDTKLLKITLKRIF